MSNSLALAGLLSLFIVYLSINLQINYFLKGVRIY